MALSLHSNVFIQSWQWHSSSYAKLIAVLRDRDFLHSQSVRWKAFMECSGQRECGGQCAGCRGQRFWSCWGSEVGRSWGRLVCGRGRNQSTVSCGLGVPLLEQTGVPRCTSWRPQSIYKTVWKYRRLSSFPVSMDFHDKRLVENETSTGDI